MDDIPKILQSPVSLSARGWGGKGWLMYDIPGILQSPAFLPARGWRERVDGWMIYLEYSSLQYLSSQGMERLGLIDG